MPTTATITYSGNPITPALGNSRPLTLAVKLPASVTYEKGDILGEIVGTNEVQTITISATGGTFTATFSGQTTSDLAYNATAAVVQAALEGLSTIGAGNVSVSLNSSVYTVTFQNDLGYQNVAAMTTNAGSLTGGSGTATVATATAGVAGTAGTFKKVSTASTDGSQTARAILPCDAQTDSDGKISFGDVSTGMEHGQKYSTVDVYVAGDFDLADLPDLTQTDIDNLNGRIIKGSIYAGGILHF